MRRTGMAEANPRFQIPRFCGPRNAQRISNWMMCLFSPNASLSKFITSVTRHGGTASSLITDRETLLMAATARRPRLTYGGSWQRISRSSGRLMRHTNGSRWPILPADDQRATAQPARATSGSDDEEPTAVARLTSLNPNRYGAAFRSRSGLFAGCCTSRFTSERHRAGFSSRPCTRIPRSHRA